MNLAVVVTSLPFSSTPGARAGAALVDVLPRFGHRAELVKVPCDLTTTESVLDAMVAAATLRIRGVDRIIVTSFPSYYVRHEQRVGWIDEPFPAASAPGPSGLLQQVARNMDARQFATMTLFAAEPVVRAQLAWLDRPPIDVLPVPDGCEQTAWESVVGKLTQ